MTNHTSHSRRTRTIAQGHVVFCVLSIVIGLAYRNWHHTLLPAILMFSAIGTWISIVWDMELIKRLSRSQMSNTILGALSSLVLGWVCSPHYSVVAILPWLTLIAVSRFHDRMLTHHIERYEQQARLLNISASLGGVIDSNSFFSMLIHQAAQFIPGFTRSALYLVEGSGKDAKLVLQMAIGFDHKRLAEHDIPLSSGQSALATCLIKDNLYPQKTNAPHLPIDKQLSAKFDLGDYVAVPLNGMGQKKLGALLIEYKLGLPDLETFESLYLLKRQISTTLENRLLYETIRNISIRDEMTGLNNYRYFKDRLSSLLKQRQRLGKPLCTAIIDIDFFKKYNDEFGHDVGDQALKACARVLNNYSRAGTIVARYGGEEFVIVDTEASKQDFAIAMERIRQAVMKVNVTTKDGKPTRTMSVSIGLAQFPTDGDTPDTLLKAADDALYISKNHGRNRITLAGQTRPIPTDASIKQ